MNKEKLWSNALNKSWYYEEREDIYSLSDDYIHPDNYLSLLKRRTNSA